MKQMLFLFTKVWIS